MLGSRSETGRSLTESCLKNVNETFMYIPIIPTLKNIFQNQSVRKLIDNEQPSSDTDFLHSFKDGTQFKTHSFLQCHKNSIRISLYCDEIECANAIGSKSAIHKISVFYFTIQNFTSYVNSDIKNIFLLAVCYSGDVKKYGYKSILRPFFNDLKMLESAEGIELHYENELFTLRATLVSFIGDSLAVNDIYGFLSPASNRFCRMCLINRDEIKSKTSNFELRTKSAYLNQLHQINSGEIDSKDVGIRELSALNDSNYFHILDNYSFDCMHDILEGVLGMEIKLVLKYVIKKNILL